MKIVKISIDYISSPLTHIFNLCISEGIFPQKMKNSIIKPNNTSEIYFIFSKKPNYI